MKTKRFAVYWLPVIACAAVILYLSTVPGSDIPTPITIDLSPIHAAEYFVLSFLLYSAFDAEGWPKKRILVLTIVISIVYGIFTESLQIFVPGRTFDIYDIFLKIGGTFLIFYKRYFDFGKLPRFWCKF